MALQSLARPILWPGIVSANPTKTLAVTLTLDAAGEYAGVVFRATEAMTISHVLFRTSTATGSPTVDVRIETVSNTTGLPSGTLWAANTNAISPTLATNTVYTVALTASATIAAGDLVAVKFVYNSGTSIILVRLDGGSLLGSMGLPYIVQNTGTPTKFAISSYLCAALGSSSTVFYNVDGFIPVSASAEQTFSTSSGDAFGNRFQVPFKCRCVGLVSTSLNRTGEYTYGIYNDAGTELSSSSTSFDIDQTANGNLINMYLRFDSPVTLDPATWYRIALWPTSATLISVQKWTTATDASEAMPYVNFHYTTKATGGGWTDTATTEALAIDLILDQLDDGASASSGGGIRMAGHGGLAA